VPPAAQPLAIQGTDHDLAISPDGSYIVYRAGPGPGPAAQAELVVRSLSDLDARPLAGTSGARNPFISPDGRWVAFFAAGELRKVSLTGGPLISLCRMGGAPRGGSWGDDDTIVFGATQRGLLRVSASGGEPKSLTSPATAGGEVHLFPSVLPGAQAVLFTAMTGAAVESARVDVMDLKTGQQKTLLRGGHDAVYSESGHLVSAAAPGVTNSRASGSLRAVRFDAKRLEVTSDQVPVPEEVLVMQNGAADFTLSRRGALVYVPGLIPLMPPRSLAWVDRHG